MEKRYVVGPSALAVSVGSGTLRVLSTPSLVGYVENACLGLAQEGLGEGDTTVGTRVEIDHLAPSAEGAEVTVSVELTGSEGRMRHFAFEARQGDKVIARGRHSRCVVNADRFMAKVQ